MRIMTPARFTLVTILALALAACGSSGGGSEGSGEVVLYTSEPQENADTLISAFNEDYPDIEVQVVIPIKDTDVISPRRLRPTTNNP